MLFETVATEDFKDVQVTVFSPETFPAKEKDIAAIYGSTLPNQRIQTGIQKLPIFEHTFSLNSLQLEPGFF